MSGKKYAQMGICALLIIFAIYGIYSFCSGNLHNNGGGAAAVADRIESAEKLTQQAEAERDRAEAGITEAEKSAARIEEGIKQSADYNSQIAASIDRCQQMLDRIRQRGKSKTPEN